MTLPVDNPTAQCPVCGNGPIEQPAVFCNWCGAAVAGDAMSGAIGELDAPCALEALAPGTQVSGRYVVDALRSRARGVNLYEAHLEDAPSERVLLVERPSSDADPLAEAGLTGLTEATVGEPNPFRTEHILLSKFDYTGIVKSRSV